MSYQFAGPRQMDTYNSLKKTSQTTTTTPPNNGWCSSFADFNSQIIAGSSALSALPKASSDEFLEQKLFIFHCIGWFMGILILVYYNPYKAGKYNPLHTLNNEGPFFSLLRYFPNLCGQVTHWSDIFWNGGCISKVDWGLNGDCSNCSFSLLLIPCFLLQNIHQSPSRSRSSLIT